MTRKLVTSLAIALAVARCSPPSADAAPVMVSGPKELSGALALGDSLGPYTFSVAPVPGATGYTWTLTADSTNGAWTGFSGRTTISDTLVFYVPLAVLGSTWDSVHLHLTVKGTSAVRSSKGALTSSWRVLRWLPSPTSLTGDSSKLGPLSMMVRSLKGALPVANNVQQDTMYAGATTQLCAFIYFGSGLVHEAQSGRTPSCDSIATVDFKFARTSQTPTAAEASWLSGSCSAWSSCLSGLGFLRVRPDALYMRRA